MREPQVYRAKQPLVVEAMQLTRSNIPDVRKWLKQHGVHFNEARKTLQPDGDTHYWYKDNDKNAHREYAREGDFIVKLDDASGFRSDYPYDPVNPAVNPMKSRFAGIPWWVFNEFFVVEEG